MGGTQLQTSTFSYICRKKARFEFEENMHETDKTRIQGLLQLADLQLDNVLIQVRLLPFFSIWQIETRC